MHTDSLFYRDPIIDLIETILVYKFPTLSREEIQTMLHLPETDLKKTRFYQEVFSEGEAIGRKEGEKRGEKRGERLGELALALRLLKRRLGALTAAQQGQIERLSTADLDALGDALLDFTGAADLDHWLEGPHRGQ